MEKQLTLEEVEKIEEIIANTTKGCKTALPVEVRLDILKDYGVSNATITEIECRLRGILRGGTSRESH